MGQKEGSSNTVTRRDFVKSSMGAAAVAPFAMTGLSAATSAHVAGTDELRVGLVGCGGRGTGAAGQALNADPGVVITALADAFPERIDSTLKSLQGVDAERVRVDAAHCFGGLSAYQQLIDSGVDVVLLATPPVFRPEQLRACVNAGKHVFCEKPMAVDGPGLRSIIESAKIAQEKKLSLVSGFCWRYAAHMREIFARLHDGALGAIRGVQCTYNTSPLGYVPRKEGWSDMEWQLRNWKAFIWSSGDHIVEQAVHAIDWIPWAFGNDVPTKAYAVGGRIAREGDASGNMYDHFSVHYEYDDGRRGYHMSRQIANCKNDNTGFIMGEKGTCMLNPWAPAASVIRTEDGEWRYKGPPSNMYQQEHDELFASIRNGEPMNDGEWMANSTLMGILGRETAYTGQEITWEQMLNSEKSYTPESWNWGDHEIAPVPVPGQAPKV